MMGFRNFTAPLWELFAGNLLLLICFIFYLVWWAAVFRPGSTGGPFGTICILAAFLTGTAAIMLLAGGINSLSADSTGIPVKLIFLAVGILFFVLMIVTSVFFHRIVTSELMIIHFWIALELSVIAVLYGTGHLAPGRTAGLSILVAIAFITSMICYVLYYRLSGMAGYYDGMVPLLSASFVEAVILGVTAVS